MSTIYFSRNVNASPEQMYFASNGATRPNLYILNKSNIRPESTSEMHNVRLGTLDKGNNHYIFINDSNGSEAHSVYGIVMSNGYGFELLEGTLLWSANSCGGYGNSESAIGVCLPGAIFKLLTYKHRTPPTYMKLTECGWITLADHQLFQHDIEDI